MPRLELVSQFHHLFWMGDLNYRVNWQPLKDQKMNHKDNCEPHIFQAFESYLHRKALKVIFRDDQLRDAMANSNAFFGFLEPNVQFPPTFKVDRAPGLPSWCDRILYRSATTANPPKVHSYDALANVSYSDHKPVELLLDLDIWERPPGVDDSVDQAIVHFEDCSVDGLSPTMAASDVYLHWPKQQLLEKSSNTCRINKVSHSKRIEPLVLLRNSVTFLRQALLLLEVRHHDHLASRRFFMGQGYLSLAPALENIEKWTFFDVELILAGLYVGKFQGRYKVVIKKISSISCDTTEKDNLELSDLTETCRQIRQQRKLFGGKVL
ncbi:hypothetical protein RFI_18529 [Reticulomyxa filosa]|uniref:Inositol polyphosphate-related phosphatase domain-containing protein n=1 Tax=Reticulomyxa filosa TaxID=46433 RepID=X6MXH3_RETFI|nr:hypothetical protein RFI_18529 [Reticulomyxa filosa]|eukprot:ETO18725.1 hypothetical protein RFI_18529 [Reticulomyxa filosa]